MQSELIEKLGVFFEKEEHWSPIAARILAMITLAGKKGVTFDELVSTLCASKSTVSIHLDSLQKQNRISSYTLEGDRKRHFVLALDLILTYLNGLEEEWKERKLMNEEVKCFQEKSIVREKDAKDNYDIGFMDSFIEYTDEVIRSIQKLKRKIKQ